MNAAERLAEAFADQAARWALQSHADPERAAHARQLALRASLGVGEGHTCVALDPHSPGAPPAALVATAVATGIVGTPAAPGSYPLICDAQGHLYLHRYFDYERRLAAAVVRIAGADAPTVRTATAAAPAGRTAGTQAPMGLSAEVQAALAGLFRGNRVGADGIDWQQVAVAQALQQRFTVLCGGPGSGKTSTVVRLLACLLTASPEARIVLAAPTGKAAARLQEALPALAQLCPSALPGALPRTASTVHRLLGYEGHQRRYRHGAGRPLALDVLIVDEASMLDLALATRLCEAVPTGARLVLLGDRDQLAAVESGAVFAELSRNAGLDDADCARIAAATGIPAARLRAQQPPSAGPAVLPGSVAQLRHSFRFGAGLPMVQFAAAVRDGRADDAMTLLAAGSNDLQWDAAAAETPAAMALLERTLADGYAGYLACLQARAPEAAVFAAFDRFRVLCAVRAGPWGSVRLADAISRRLRHGLDMPGLDAGGPAARADALFDSCWYRGRPVMVLGNDPLLQVFNGDIGIALPNAEGELQVCFLRAGDSAYWVDPVRLPSCETAFATTIHKSQGSEFERVAIVLPPQAGGTLLSRELLYTAVTRARDGVRLVAGAHGLRAAIGTPTERQSGLLARLTEARAQQPSAGFGTGGAPAGLPSV